MSTKQYATRYSELKKSDAYYILITRVFDSLQHKQPHLVSAIMQYLSDLLLHTDSTPPTPGLFIEYNYKRIVVERHSPQFILNFQSILNITCPPFDRLPHLCCVVARPAQPPEPEQCIDIIETVRDESIQAFLAVLLSGLRVTRPRKLLKTRKGFYDPKRKTLINQELPRWVTQYVERQYNKTTREKDMLFLDGPSKEHIHRAAQKVKAEIQRIKTEHNIDIDTIFRYKSYWTRINDKQLHYVGYQFTRAQQTLQNILKKYTKQQTNM